MFRPKWFRAEVPLAEMFGYATDVRSASQGRATLLMEFQVRGTRYIAKDPLKASRKWLMKKAS